MNPTPVVLYVEDDMLSRRVVELLLKMRLGIETLYLFDDSSDFLARVRALTPKPDVIFLDIHVKPHDGFEMLTLLRAEADYRDVPIVALTASVMNEEVRRLQQAGFDGCLAKPLDAGGFPEAFDRIVAKERVWRITS